MNVASEPSIAFGPLKIWILGRQYPEARDYWDGNWLFATAQIQGEGSRVEVNGAFLHLNEIKTWKNDLESFRQTLDGTVELDTVEPTLKVEIKGRESRTGHLDCLVKLTGEHMSEKHHFYFEIDQSYLPGLITQLAAVLREHPIRNEEQH